MTRSIHMPRLAIWASRSRSSHEMGPPGQVPTWTVSAIDECPASIDHMARSAAGVAAMAQSAASTSLPCFHR